MRAPAPARLIAAALVDCSAGSVAPAPRRGAWNSRRRRGTRARRSFVATCGRRRRRPADDARSFRPIFRSGLAVQVRIVAPDDQQFAEVLDRRAGELAADLGKQRIALAAHIIEHADLDELMCFERNIDLMQHGGRQSMRSDRDDGAQMVRLGAQRAALFGGHIVHARSLPCAVEILSAGRGRHVARGRALV